MQYKAVTTQGGTIIYCVIQEIKLKKSNQYGAHKELEAYQSGYTFNNLPFTYAYRYTGGRFEREHMEAYRIAIHQSYRENGAVKKTQFSICTISYYDLIDYSLYDCADGRITKVADSLNVSIDALYTLIEAKIEPIRVKAVSEFHKTQEYKVSSEHERIIKKHQKSRDKFCKKYDVDGDEYDRCYNVFGELVNKEYLDEIIRQCNERERSYSDSFHSNYNNTGYSGSSYGVSISSTYTDNEREQLKQFYKILSKKFHPDLNPDKDTKAEMQLINRLKDEWGV